MVFALSGFAQDSPLEESGFELMVPPRTERKWEGAGTGDLPTVIACVYQALSGLGKPSSRSRRAAGHDRAPLGVVPRG